MVFQDTAAALNPALTIGAQLTEPMRLHLGTTRQRRLGPRHRAARRDRHPAPGRDHAGLPAPALRRHEAARRHRRRAVDRAGPAAAGRTHHRAGRDGGGADPGPAGRVAGTPASLDAAGQPQPRASSTGSATRWPFSTPAGSPRPGVRPTCCTGRATPYTKGLLAALPRPDRPHAGRLAPIPGGLPDLTQARPRLQLPPSVRLRHPGLRAATITDRRAQRRRLPSRDGAGRRRLALGRRLGPVHRTTSGRPVPAGGARPHRPLRDRRSVGTAARQGSQRAGRGRRLAADRRRRSGGPGGRVRLRQVHARAPAAAAVAVARRPDPVRRPARGDRPADPAFRRRAQIVFQNPDSSLNPRQTVGAILARPVRWFATAPDVAAEVDRLLDLVHLPRRYATRYPHQLSGGEKQRVGIARASPPQSPTSSSATRRSQRWTSRCRRRC